eukprot:Sspe_Gene.91928::Locus_63589_Transcript_1_2_Confidence_0.333_Length_441::g.91928::m.91928
MLQPNHAGGAGGGTVCYICGETFPNRTVLGMHIAVCYKELEKRGEAAGVPHPMDVVMEGYTMYVKQHNGGAAGGGLLGTPPQGQPGQPPLPHGVPPGYIPWPMPPPALLGNGGGL